MAEPEDRTKVARNYDNSVFVGNIPFESTSQDIKGIFAQFGIVRADIVTNRGRSRGMATVEFSSKQDVVEAISKFDRTKLNGREIFVRQDYPPPEEKRRAEREARKEREPRERERPERERPVRERREKFNPNEAPKPGTEVFVGNLPFSTNWQTLKDLMRSVGDVARADVMADRWGKSRGFGTVVFSTPEDAAAAVAKFQGYNLDGRHLDVRPGRDVNGKRAPPAVKNTEFTEGVSGDGGPSAVIFTGNLPFITTQSDLFELFETIGHVNRAEIQYNETGRASGNAVVEFESVDLADLAIKNLDGYNYGGRDLRITYARTPGAASEVAQEEEPEMEMN